MLQWHGCGLGLITDWPGVVAGGGAGVVAGGWEGLALGLPWFYQDRLTGADKRGVETD